MSGTLSVDDHPDGVDAHYIRESSAPEIDDEGREIWLYVYSPGAGDCPRNGVRGQSRMERRKRSVGGTTGVGEARSAALSRRWETGGITLLPGRLHSMRVIMLPDEGNGLFRR